jgi:CBS domain-containing protein
MHVNSCMSKDVRITSPAEPIWKAALLMKEIDAGFLPVGESDRLVGAVTDRDIAIRAVAAGKGPDTPVRDVMTKAVHYCFEDEDLETVAVQMSEFQVRRLPVLNRNKRLVGIISLSDICRTGFEYAPLTGATLRSVSTHDRQHVSTDGRMRSAGR